MIEFILALANAIPAIDAMINKLCDAIVAKREALAKAQESKGIGEIKNAHDEATTVAALKDIIGGAPK